MTRNEREPQIGGERTRVSRAINMVTNALSALGVGTTTVLTVVGLKQEEDPTAGTAKGFLIGAGVTAAIFIVGRVASALTNIRRTPRDDAFAHFDNLYERKS